MWSNTSVMSTERHNGAQAFLLSQELTLAIYVAFRQALIPCVSIVGIVGNVASIVILTRRGFRKCSNILLLALSISDVLFLTGLNNIFMFIYDQGNPSVFMISYNINYLFYILYMVLLCFRHMGLQTVMILPSLITAERVLAIFIPLKVYIILTRRRSLIVVLCLYIVNGIHFLYVYILCIQFKQFAVKGGSYIGVFLTTEIYLQDIRSGLYQLIHNITNYMTGIIQICLVTVGCVVIGLRVIVITNRRKQLVSNQVKLPAKTLISKTTKTLLSICILFILCSGSTFVVAFIANTPPIDKDFAMQKVLVCVQDLIICVNCVGDFVIYIGGRKSSRKTVTSWCRISNHKG
ncbi:unnamed protein product [Candidula unifasciata]|uniref:G-protein coupled receptors family 1 profile domain-containing protein n=1 Tax=Candidula unifasciata TaxID=100452 RepID=A0A8S3YWD8_9EUPU|nr:unnamed protein product [Candidula unifasciata]